MLDIEQLDVSIGTVNVLRGVDMQVGDGQFVGLIGRNGACKTTLMRAIMGILPPRGGNLSYRGQPLVGVPTHRRARDGIGYMPEDRRLVPALTVEENVLIPAWAGKRADARERLRQIYRMIPEVESFATRRGLQLSGGQQKLVALARALMSGTRLLLLDEPFEGVAPVLARRLSEVIGGLRTEGLSIILTESDLSHSRDILDRVYTIDRGAVSIAV